MLHSDTTVWALAGNERWFLVHTLPKSEQKADLRLRAQGFRCYLPLFEKTIRHARKLRTVRAPLFPRYLFLVLDLAHDSWSPVRGTIGVSRLFSGQDGRPVPVPVGVVESLIERSDGQAHAVGYRAHQGTARSHPVRAVREFCRHACKAGRCWTGTSVARNDGNRGSGHASPFGACAGGVKNRARREAAASFCQVG